MPPVVKVLTIRVVVDACSRPVTLGEVVRPEHPRTVSEPFAHERHVRQQLVGVLRRAKQLECMSEELQGVYDALVIALGQIVRGLGEERRQGLASARSLLCSSRLAAAARRGLSAMSRPRLVVDGKENQRNMLLCRLGEDLTARHPCADLLPRLQSGRSKAGDASEVHTLHDQLEPAKRIELG